MKKLDEWMLHELTEHQQFRHFEVCLSLILRNKSYPFPDGVVKRDKHWILYDNQVGPQRSSETVSSAGIAQHKVMVTV